MEPSTPALTVVYSATALKELDKIWSYNAKTYASSDHANDYVDFLKAKIKSHSTKYEDGRTVARNEKLRYIVMKRSTQGKGHIAVYRITKTSVRIARVLHTSQNWENEVKLKSESMTADLAEFPAFGRVAQDIDKLDAWRQRQVCALSRFNGGKFTAVVAAVVVFTTKNAYQQREASNESGAA